MTFLLGFVVGIALALLFAVLMSFVVVGARHEDPDPEEQPDIHLTKIKSNYVRTFRHD